LILKEALSLLVIGLGAGVVLSLWAGQAAATMLYGLKPYDPISLIALAASFVPARRAAALQPMTALREE